MSLLQWYPLNGNINNQGLSSRSATSSGTPAYVNNGITGKCLSNGGLILSAEATNEVLNNSALTIAFWIKPLNTNSGIIFGNDPTGESNNRKFSLYQYPTGNDLHFSWMNDTASQTFISTSSTVIEGVLPTNVWTHVCVTYNNPDMAVYINGVSVRTGTGVSTSSTFAYETYILRSNTNRHIADLRIYDHCLSTQEINNLSKGLVAQYSDNVNHNLAVNSRNNYTYSGFNDSGNSTTGAASWTANAGTYNGMTVCKWAQGKNGKNTVGPYFNTNAKFGATFVVGETYTISAYVRADTPGTLNSNGLGEGQSIQKGSYKVNSTWTRVWSTFKATKASHNCCFYSQANSSTATGYFYMCGVKIERGEHVTAWTNNSNTSTIRDMSGNGNHGKNTGCYLSTPVKVGLLSIDTASSGYMTLTSLYLNTSFTICGWVYFKSFATWARVFDFGTATEGSGYDIGMAISDSANGRVTVFGRCGSGTALPDTAVTSVALNTWYHFAITISGTSLKVYWNGSLLTSWTTTSAIGNQLYTLNYLGKSNWSADGYMQEHINDFRIYNTALSASDVKDIYDTKTIIDNKSNLYCSAIVEDASTSEIASAEGVTKVCTILDDYEELECIEATGSQYIKTGVIGPAIWEYDIQYTNTTERQLMGHGPNGSEYWGTTDGAYKMSTGYASTIKVGNRDIFRVENLTSGRKIYVNGVYSHTETYDTRCESVEAQIFAISGGWNAYCRLWGCKVWQNNILIRDFVPVKRNSDRALGLLDKVNGNFYARSGSGTFLSKQSTSLKVYGGYERLEYLQSTGTQYIDTGIKLNLDSDKFEIDFQANDSTGNYFIAGSGWQENGKIWVYNYPSGTRFSCYATNTSGNQIEFYGYSGPDDYFHTITYDARKLYCDGTLTQDRTSETFGSTPYNFSLFNAVNSTGYYAKTKISRFRVWKSGALVRDMVAAKRKSDSVLGMLDLVGMKFYTNAGSGSFTAGTSKGEFSLLSSPNIYEGMGASVASYKIDIPALVEYKLSISTGTGTSVLVNRTYSSSGGTGSLVNGAVIYEGDILTITRYLNDAYNASSFTVNNSSFTSGSSLTVSGNVSISATASVKTFKFTGYTDNTGGIVSTITINRNSSPYGGGSTGTIFNTNGVASGTYPVLTDIILYYGDELSFSGTYNYLDFSGGSKPSAGTDNVKFQINGVTTYNHTVTSNVSIIGLPGGSSSGGSAGSFTLSCGSLYEAMSTYSGFIVPAGLQAAFANGSVIGGTIYWTVMGQERSATFSGVNISGGTITWGGGVVRLQGYTTATTVPGLLASGVSGTQNVGGMIGSVSVSVDRLVVTSWT